MKRWMSGGIVWAVVGLVAYLGMTMTQAPAPTPQAKSPAVATVPTPPAQKIPVTLIDVVDVTDIDPLLDPSEKPISGVPFEAEPPTVPITSVATPQQIPLAVD